MRLEQKTKLYFLMPVQFWRITVCTFEFIWVSGRYIFGSGNAFSRKNAIEINVHHLIVASIATQVEHISDHNCTRPHGSLVSRGDCAFTMDNGRRRRPNKLSNYLGTMPGKRFWARILWKQGDFFSETSSHHFPQVLGQWRGHCHQPCKLYLLYYVGTYSK